MFTCYRLGSKLTGVFTSELSKYDPHSNDLTGTLTKSSAFTDGELTNKRSSHPREVGY